MTAYFGLAQNALAVPIWQQ